MKHYLDTAENAARAAGDLLRKNFHRSQHVNVAEAHDIKLAIDVETQELITKALLKQFPEHALYGEEGIVGDQSIDSNLPLLEAMIHRVRKCRVLGSAALDMAYVACGRFDAYIERGISLWDIAAGWILVETAGGRVDLRPRKDMKDKYSIVASNGVIDLKL